MLHRHLGITNFPKFRKSNTILLKILGYVMIFENFMVCKTKNGKFCFFFSPSYALFLFIHLCRTTFLDQFLMQSFSFFVSYLCKSDSTGTISDRNTGFNKNIFLLSTNGYFNRLLLPGTIHNLWCNGVCHLKEKSHFTKNGCYKIICIYYIILNNIFSQYTAWMSLHMFILISKNAIMSWVYTIWTSTIHWTI